MPSTVRRALVIAGLATILPRCAWSAPEQLEVSLSFNRQLNALVTSATQLLRLRRTMEAIELLAQANALVEGNPATRWPWRIRVGPVYGHALLGLGRNEEALQILERTLDAVEQVRVENVPPFRRVLDHWDTGMGQELLNTEFKRQLVAVAVTDGPSAHTLDELVFDESIGSSEPLFTLGRALVVCGKAEALIRLYQEKVAGAVISPADNIAAGVAREHRSFKFGVLLGKCEQSAVAEQAFSRALQLNFERLQDMAGRVPSHTAMLAGFGVGREMLSLRLGHFLSQPKAVTPAADGALELVQLIVQYKGLGVRYAEDINLLLRTSQDSAVIGIRPQLGALEDQMAELSGTNEGFSRFLALSVQQSQLLMQVLPGLRTQGAEAVIQPGATLLPEILRALGRDAAIGFMEYRAWQSFVAGSKERRYLRYCITGDTIQLQDVGSCDVVDQEIYRFRGALLTGNDGHSHGSLLARQLLSDLPGGVEAADHWVIDPDGALTLLPFEALPDTDGPLLLRRSVRYVTSLAQLDHARKSRPAEGPACILANPAYPQMRQQSKTDSSLRMSVGHFERGLGPVSPLPDTALEAASVKRSLARLAFEVASFEGQRATPDALLGLKQPPKILHVASHAVFLESVAASTGAVPGRAASGASIVDLVLPGRRAALVLSGEQAPAILLAKDLVRLPLSGTRLVVLSGCDTGNGDVDVGEGVASLRRALEQAGATSTVTSLWSVPSQATAGLMSEFYLGLERGLRKSQALQEAKQKLHGQGHPASAWAGFLLAGSDEPLEKWPH
ncbi:CHAT domain-containing protein [Ralstonia insidiosa]|uniref:CHAT domain-containing protein n=1 Tax=Ralstonia insidiosa TaxID=190721 RepID=A0A848PBB4_9RALS|nr:CHAT domain-containing tetratricopeptide repeat protein [Ralstonia insidiosa]NMV41954.1 CHAT domain-containing protein [Ralstonia insidiosa]